MIEFEIFEGIGVPSKVSSNIEKVRPRRQLNFKPSRFIAGPSGLDLAVGSIHLSRNMALMNNTPAKPPHGSCWTT